MQPNPQISLAQLLPFCTAQTDHQIVIFKSFFDGGNQPDSRLYDVLSLSSVSGTLTQWKAFESDWKAVLKANDAPFLHTTDAVSLKNFPFTEENGWNKTRRDTFISECVSVVERHLAIKGERRGIVPYVVTIVLKDFIRATKTHPKLSKDATELLAMQAVEQSFRQGAVYGAHWFSFVFDQNEPFKKHIEQRKQNKKANKALKALHDRIVGLTTADMRHSPALQMADLIAWCVSHKQQKPRHAWQNRILNNSNHFDDWKDYDKIVDVRPGMHEVVASWNLPRHTPTR